MKQHFTKILCTAALWVSFMTTAVASPTPYTLYDNSAPGVYNGGANGSLTILQSGDTIGTQITTAGEAWLSSIQLQYNAPISFGIDDVAMTVSIYKNTGALIGGQLSPGTFVWSYTAHNVPGNFPLGQSLTIDSSLDPSFDGLYLTAGTFTITTMFTDFTTPANMGGFGVYIPLSGNPSGQIGSSLGDYWYGLNNSSWDLLTGPVAGNANMLMIVEATPEPSTLALAAIGGVLLLGVNKLKRKRA